MNDFGGNEQFSRDGLQLLADARDGSSSGKPAAALLARLWPPCWPKMDSSADRPSHRRSDHPSLLR